VFSISVVNRLSRSLQAALASTVVVLPVFWSLGQLRTWWSPPLDAVVFAVLLAVGLPHAVASLDARDFPAAGAALLAGAAGAVGCGMLLDGTSWHKAAGAALFAIGVALPVWLRRLGPAWRAGGIVAAIPFLAVLVHPLPDQASWIFLGWMLLAAGIACSWAAAIHFLAGPAPAPAQRTAPARPASSRRVAASTRMAVQLALAVGAAFAFGQWTDPGHLVWPVMTVLVVHSGNRSRGDVLWKGAERTVGALAGTAIATCLTGLLPPGDSLAIVAVFAILALADGLREISYAYRAACTTGALAFFYGYFGQTGAGLLAHRLLGVVAGAAIGVAAAWLVLPVRTTDVTRLRVGALLASATALATAAAGAPDSAALDRLAAADRELAMLTPTLRAARRFGIGAARHLDHTVTRAQALASEAKLLATSQLSTGTEVTPPDAKVKGDRTETDITGHKPDLE
jgi:Fusaric acid resistance protein-like